MPDPARAEIPASTGTRMPRRLKRVVRAALGLVVLSVIAWYLYNHADDFLLLRELDLRYLPIMLAVPLAGVWINGQILRLLVRELGIHLSFAEWYGLTVLHAFGNYLPIPQAGTIARGVYLKKSRGLDYVSFTATVVVTYVEFLTCVGFVGLALAALMSSTEHALPWPFWLLFSGLAATLVLFLPVRWPVPVARRLEGFRDALVALRRSHLLLRVGALQLALIALNVVGLWLAFISLGRTISVAGSALLSLASMTSGILNVTPGNVGVAESAAWITAQMTGGNAEEAVVAFTLFRLLAVVVVFALTPLFMSRLSVKFGVEETEEKAEDNVDGV